MVFPTKLCNCHISLDIHISFLIPKKVGARALEMGCWGAYQNILTNLKDINDKTFVANVKSESLHFHQLAVSFSKNVLKILQTRQTNQSKL